MNTDVLMICIVIVLSIIIIILAKWYELTKHADMYKDIVERVDKIIGIVDNKLTEDNSERSISQIDYTKKMIDFIVSFVSDKATLSYRSFIDDIDMKKTNKSILVKYISQVAEEVKKDLRTNINYNDLLVTEEYIDSLIVDTTVYVIKSLWEKSYASAMETEDISIE